MRYIEVSFQGVGETPVFAFRNASDSRLQGFAINLYFL